MSLYRITKMDMMGFRISEYFFSNIQKARDAYATLLMEYRQLDYIVEKGEESHLSGPIVKGVSRGENIIKEHMIELWHKTSYEYDEWDTHVESIILEKINIDEEI